MKKVVYCLLMFISSLAYGQSRKNALLKHQLDSVSVLDQKYRDTLKLLMMPATKDALLQKIKLTSAEANDRYLQMQSRLDSLNLIFVEAVMKKQGYPGTSLVGAPTDEVAWNVIQHSNKIARYLPVIKAAAELQQLPYRLYATMLDRYLMNDGQEQIYGTQGTCRELKNGTQECFIWPVKDPEKVNSLRKKSGFDSTVEANAARLGVSYRVVKLSEVQ